MRILMLSDVSFPRVNGVSTSIETFRQSLSELGHESVLVTPDYPTGVVEAPDVIRIPSRRIPYDPEDRLMSPAMLRALTPRLAAGRFDVLHIHTPFVAHYAGVRLARQLHLPVVETYHTFFEEYLHHYVPLVPRRITRPFARRLSLSQCRAVDALVVPSVQMLNTLRAYGVKTRAEVLPTGIEPARFVGGNGKRFRDEHGISPTRPLLVHISRVAHEKNIDFIVEALVHIRRSVPDVLLAIAGEGPAVSHIKRLVVARCLTEHVLFVGYLARDSTLLDCYRAGDAFVFASRTETQGLVLLEALALGVPVVSTAVMGTRDVLANAKGALIAPDDVCGFASVVTRVLADPALRATLAAAAPSDIATWTARAMAQRLLALYDSLQADGQSLTH